MNQGWNHLKWYACVWLSKYKGRFDDDWLCFSSMCSFYAFLLLFVNYRFVELSCFGETSFHFVMRQISSSSSSRLNLMKWDLNWNIPWLRSFSSHFCTASFLYSQCSILWIPIHIHKHFLCKLIVFFLLPFSLPLYCIILSILDIRTFSSEWS